MEFVNLSKLRREGRLEYCVHFPHGYVKCESGGRNCTTCTFADRVRRERYQNLTQGFFFLYIHALKQTEKSGGDTWLNYPIILSPDVMKKHNIEPNLLFQIAVADFGPGVFLKNPVGFIDCHLFALPTKKFTISRNEAYGIPNETACRRYDGLFFLGLEEAVKKQRSKKGVWCL